MLTMADPNRGPGLSGGAAAARLTSGGPNELPPSRRTPAIVQFVHQFTHLLAVLLWVAAEMTLLADQPVIGGAIVVVVVLNAVFGFAQEYRADRAIELLGAMIPRQVLVHRDNHPVTVDAASLVVLGSGGWRWGGIPSASPLGAASGTAFAAIVLGQLANAFACRSETVVGWRMPLRSNRLLLVAVAVEVALLLRSAPIPELGQQRSTERT